MWSLAKGCGARLLMSQVSLYPSVSLLRVGNWACGNELPNKASSEISESPKGHTYLAPVSPIPKGEREAIER